MRAGRLLRPRIRRDPRVLAIDAGGTMTDTFIVDRSGDIVIGNAQTTPENQAVGLMASARDAFGYGVWRRRR